MTKLLIFT